MANETAVLVADGSHVVRRLLGDFVGRLGRPVLLAEDVDQACRAVACDGPEYAVVDADLPGGGARPVLSKARSLAGVRPQLIVIARNPSLKDETLYSLAGAVAYLSKPVALAELRRLVGRPGIRGGSGQ